MTDRDGNTGFQTRSVHAGEPHPKFGGAVAMPVFQSSTFLSNPGQNYHELRYIRLNNTPNHRAVEAKLAALEETEDALVTASGMAAITTTLLCHLRPGDHVISQDCLYGGTRELMQQIFKRQGIDVSFVSLEDSASWDAARRPETRVFYAESTSNPLLEVGRLDEAAQFAKAHDLVSIIDNTFPSPVNFRPTDMGYDIVVHSATKYLNGHTDICAGVVAASKENVKRARELLNITGGSLDPHPCWLLHRGLKTLPLRVRAQNHNAMVLATALAKHPAVQRVRFPGLPEDPSHDRAARWFEGFGAMLAFTPCHGVAAADSFCDRVKIPLTAPSLGGVETLVTRPALTSHAGLAAETRREMGIDDGLVRVSVGIEDAEDLVRDFVQALDA